MSFGRIMDGENVLDEALASVFRAPHSFTGEEIVEFACHGSQYIQQELLKLLIRHGARLAAPGEFTQRAFLNGRMDLTQAEAVADIITAESAAAHRVAMQQMRGGFSEELRILREQLLNFVSLLELELDFSEEEVEFADRSQLSGLLHTMKVHIDRLRQSFALGNAIKNGVPVAIAGPTNVGKSTLLNALLGEERAIVSDIHGTTRDTIEDCIQLGGITFRFIDTAGIRHTTETIEQLGIERSYDKIRQAAIVLLVLDASRPETFSAVDDIAPHISGSQQLIVVMNKADLQPADGERIFRENALGERAQTERLQDKKVPEEKGNDAVAFSLQSHQLTSYSSIAISAKHKQGLSGLIATLTAGINLSPISRDETVLTNVRHYEALTHAATALQRVDTGLGGGLPGDLVAQDLREVLFHLGSITGDISTDEILGNIFGRFCIGK